MANKEKTDPADPDGLAATKVVKFMTDYKIAPNAAVSLPPYVEVDGFRFINIFVQFSQQKADEAPVDLGIVFAFDLDGGMSAHRYANLEYNVSARTANFIESSGMDSWHGTPKNLSSYLARVAVMGPFVNVLVYNLAPVERVVSVWGYLIS